MQQDFLRDVKAAQREMETRFGFDAHATAWAHCKPPPNGALSRHEWPYVSPFAKKPAARRKPSLSPPAARLAEREAGAELERAVEDASGVLAGLSLTQSDVFTSAPGDALAESSACWQVDKQADELIRLVRETALRLAPHVNWQSDASSLVALYAAETAELLGTRHMAILTFDPRQKAFVWMAGSVAARPGHLSAPVDVPTWKFRVPRNMAPLAALAAAKQATLRTALDVTAKHTALSEVRVDGSAARVEQVSTLADAGASSGAHAVLIVPLPRESRAAATVASSGYGSNGSVFTYPLSVCLVEVPKQTLKMDNERVPTRMRAACWELCRHMAVQWRRLQRLQARHSALIDRLANSASLDMRKVITSLGTAVRQAAGSSFSDAGAVSPYCHAARVVRTQQPLITHKLQTARAVGSKSSITCEQLTLNYAGSLSVFVRDDARQVLQRYNVSSVPSQPSAKSTPAHQRWRHTGILAAVQTGHELLNSGSPAAYVMANRRTINQADGTTSRLTFPVIPLSSIAPTPAGRAMSSCKPTPAHSSGGVVAPSAVVELDDAHGQYSFSAQVELRVRQAASGFAAAISHSSLLEQTVRKCRVLRRVVAASLEAGCDLDNRRIAETLRCSASDVLRTQAAAVWLLDRSSGEMGLLAGRELELGDGRPAHNAASAAARTGKVVYEMNPILVPRLKMAAPLIPQTLARPLPNQVAANQSGTDIEMDAFTSTGLWTATAEVAVPIGVLEICMPVTGQGLSSWAPDVQTDDEEMQVAGTGPLDIATVLSAKVAGGWYNEDRDALDRLARIGATKLLSAHQLEHRISPARQLALFNGVLGLPSLTQGMARALAEAACAERVSIWAVDGSMLELLPARRVSVPLWDHGILALAAKCARENAAEPLQFDAYDSRLISSREYHYVGPCLRCLLLLPLIASDGTFVGIAAVADPRSTAQTSFSIAVAIAAMRLARTAAASLRLALAIEKSTASMAIWFKQTQWLVALTAQRRLALPDLGSLLFSVVKCRALGVLCRRTSLLSPPLSPVVARSHESVFEQTMAEAGHQDELELEYASDPAAASAILNWGAHAYPMHYRVALDLTDDPTIQPRNPQLARLGLYRSRSVLLLPIPSLLPRLGRGQGEAGREDVFGVLDVVDRIAMRKFSADDVSAARWGVAMAAMALSLDALLDSRARSPGSFNTKGLRFVARVSNTITASGID